MIALCGSCRTRFNAAKRWAQVATYVMGEGLRAMVQPDHACDGCGVTPLSPKYRHVVFDADKADLVEKEIA